jgi:hypothetical protein
MGIQGKCGDMKFNMQLTVSSSFGDEPHRMLKVIQCFGKHCSCHVQGKCSPAIAEVLHRTPAAET